MTNHQLWRPSLFFASALLAAGCAPPIDNQAATSAGLTGYIAPLTASNLANSANAAILVDGDTDDNGAVWTSTSMYSATGYPMRALIDLGGVYNVTDVELFHGQGAGTIDVEALRVGGQVANDADYSLVDAHDATTYDGWEPIAASAQTQYLRLSIDSYATYYQFSEIRARGTLASGTTTPPTTTTPPATSAPVAVAPGLPSTGYTASKGLQSFSVANYATYYILNGVAKYYGYVIGGSITSSPITLPAPAGVKLVAISAGGHSNQALDSNGLVYGTGGDIMGEMGIGRVGGLHEFFTTWTPVPTDDAGVAFDHIVKIQAGFNGSSAMKDDGSVYVWGMNGNTANAGDGGVTGLPIPTTACPWGGGPGIDPNCYATRPHRIAFPSGVKIVDYDFGDGTPLALDSNGEVWTWGYGALVNGTFQNSTVPVKVPLSVKPANVKIVQLAPAVQRYLVLGDDNHIYGWGSGIGGTYLGIGNGVYNWNPTPVAIDVTAQAGFTSLVGNIASLRSMNHGTFVVTKNGDLYSWGTQVVGAMGTGATGISQGIGIDIANSWNWAVDVDMIMKPTKILSNVAVFYTSGYTYNAFAVTTDGNLHAWGRDKFGNLGDGCIGDDYANAAVDICDVGTPKVVTPL